MYRDAARSRRANGRPRLRDLLAAVPRQAKHIHTHTHTQPCRLGGEQEKREGAAAGEKLADASALSALPLSRLAVLGRAGAGALVLAWPWARRAGAEVNRLSQRPPGPLAPAFILPRASASGLSFLASPSRLPDFALDCSRESQRLPTARTIARTPTAWTH